MVPELVGGQLVVAAPPRQEPREGVGGLLVMAIPMLGSVGSIVVVSSMNGAGGRQYVAAGMFVLATLGFVAVQADRQRSQRLGRSGGSRAAYARHLAGIRAQVREATAVQHDHLSRHHPDPAQLPLLAEEESRVFERRAGHPAFLRVRVGVAAQRPGLELVGPPEESGSLADPASEAALRRLLAVHREVPDLPAVVDLRETRRLGVSGATARAVVCSSALFHGPEDLAVAVLAGDGRLADWDWLKWLPHLEVPPGGRHRLVVVDGVAPPPEREDVTVLQVSDSDHVAGRDECSIAVAEAVARRLARRSTRAADDGAAFSWGARPPRDVLRVAIGTAADGRPVELDLKESAQGGIGPHGLLVGATGSGKSELLRTLVLRLTQTHSPDRLNLVLVDFKGGATFAGLAGLPHVSALITNLADELALVDRMQDALTGELVRRQEVLRTAGVGSVRECPDLPSLLVVVDEFAELLSARPELIDLFVAIGRLGRSLGLHLLLASQRLDEGRLRGLESHLSYRIGLRTFGAADSRAVLGVPDAAELPTAPGAGYLRTDPATLVRFAASYVSGPVAAAPARPPGVVPFRVVDARPEVVSGEGTLLDEAVRRMVGRGAPAHRIWLPPLDEPPRLEDLPSDGPGLPVGWVDRPREQRRDPLVLDLAGSRGHVAVVGGPRSGKSTLLRTVAGSLAMTSSPLDAQLFLLDLGGALAPVRGLPHVAAWATRTDTDLVRRVVAEVLRLVDRREQQGRGSDGHGEVFLVVDGCGVVRSDFDDLEPVVQQVAARGLAVGVHVVLSATRWSDLRPSLRDLLGSRLELWLGDPADSEVDRRTAALVPADRPGRGLTGDGLHFLGAVDDDDLVARARATWPGLEGPRLPVLPTVVALDDLPTGPELRLGLAEPDLAPTSLGAPHLLVLGDGGSGKTALLRLLAREVVRARTPAEAQLLVVDPRGGLAGQVPAEHLLDASLGDAVAHLRGRSRGWSGPDLFVLVDDHDLVAPTLHELVPLLPVAADVGLHVVVARRAGGAGRAMYDPLLQALRDLAAPGLLLSGSPDEGPLLGGVRPTPAAPGRGRLVTRERGVEVVQVAWVEPYSASA